MRIPPRPEYATGKVGATDPAAVGNWLVRGVKFNVQRGYYIKADSYDYEDLKNRLFAVTDPRGWKRPPAKKDAIAPNLAPLLEPYEPDETFKRKIQKYIGTWLSDSPSLGAPVKHEMSRLITAFTTPTAAATAAKAQNTQVASALLLPLFAYKVGAVINGVKLQWYLDATIAFAAVSLVVFASK